ncbi:MAG: hypothetical protein R3F40_07125 [Candidatus Competibacteraceae bacterium]
MSEASRWRSPAWSTYRLVYFYEINELDSSRRNLITGIALCQQLGMVYYTLMGQRSLAKLQHVSGEREAAWDTLTAARRLAEKSENPRRWRLIDAAAAELQLREEMSRRPREP